MLLIISDRMLSYHDIACLLQEGNQSKVSFSEDTPLVLLCSVSVCLLAYFKSVAGQLFTCVVCMRVCMRASVCTCMMYYL